MKLHIISDVHLGHGPWSKYADINSLDADVTVLAGDIGDGLEGLEWALAINRPVIFVAGNHEFYTQKSLQEFWKSARRLVESTHVHLLENEAVVISEPRAEEGAVRFLGASLWTDFSLLGTESAEQNMRSVEKVLTDYVEIRNERSGKAGTDRLTPRATLSWHHQSRDFLERELARPTAQLGGKEAWTRTVVVTHHAPSARSLPSGAARGVMDAGYASDLESLIPLADLWVHGHIHVRSDYQIGSTRVVCNPRGYASHALVDGFDPELIIEV